MFSFFVANFYSIQASLFFAYVKMAIYIFQRRLRMRINLSTDPLLTFISLELRTLLLAFAQTEAETWLHIIGQTIELRARS